MKTPLTGRPFCAVLLTTLLPLAAMVPAGRATILTFTTTPPLAANTAMPQDYGDKAAAVSQLSANGLYQNEYGQGTGWTPNTLVAYSTQRAGEMPAYFTGVDAEWQGVCRLWSSSFRTGVVIGAASPDPDKAMPVGFEYYFTFTPGAANRGVLLNSFVLDDRLGNADGIGHSVQWRLAAGSPTGTVLASGTESVTGGENLTVFPGLSPAEVVSGPVVLVIKRISGTEDDLAIDDINFEETGLPTVSYNTGSLGKPANGDNTNNVVLDQVGAVAAWQDFSTGYAQGGRTTVPYRAELNPAASSPFTIEFWARPTAFDGDDAPVGNRVGGTGDRSGWVFFQRDPVTGPGTKGWNLRMYNGQGTAVGWDLTGGSYSLNAWCHVAAVWNGSSARLIVNGVLADATNDPSRAGGYVANAADSANFYVGALINGDSPYVGQVDEIAFYPTALSDAKLLAHFNTASSRVPGAYSNLVKTDGATLYLQQNPPTATITNPGLLPTVTFTGILTQSADLLNWTDLDVTSPYTPPAPLPAKLFYRARR
jgi:hypothetical protein